MKILFLTFIALVIPLFFLLIFVFGTYNRLVGLRNRCRTSASGSGEPALAEHHRKAIEQYDEVRRSFPGNVIARLFGFRPEDSVSDEAIASTSSRVSKR